MDKWYRNFREFRKKREKGIPRKVLMGAFHSTKHSGLKFRKFHVANGTVNREIFRMVISARVDRAVPFSFGQKFPEIYDREVLQTEIFSNGTVISDQNGPTEKAVHLERWTLGAFHSTKISGKSGPKLNGTVLTNRKISGKEGPPFEVDRFFGWSVLIGNYCSIRKNFGL